MLFQDDLEKLKSLIEKPLRTLEKVEARARSLEDAIEQKNSGVVNDLIYLCEQSLAEVKGASSQIQEIKINWGSASSSDYSSRSGKQNDPRTKEQKSLKRGKVYLGQNLSAQADDSDRKKNPNLDKPRNHDKIVDDNIKTETKNITHVKLEDIHYCQAYVSDKMGDGTPIKNVIEDMKKNGWNEDKPPPDMVIYPCGKIVTVDHRRVVAAGLAGIERIPANIHKADELLVSLPEAEEWDKFCIISMLLFNHPNYLFDCLLKYFLLLSTRFMVKKDFKHDEKYQKGMAPETWGEAVMLRAANQRERGYKDFALDGTAKVPEIRSSKNQKPKTRRLTNVEKNRARIKKNKKKRKSKKTDNRKKNCIK
ncbi:MAG: hypothetical protein MGG37_20730 [Trichodesmium sp. MAG_R01]|nr:hypothetical protein [Trichodesmium sp. MAG_R01]